MSKSSIIVLLLVLCIFTSILSLPLVSASSVMWNQTYGGEGRQVAYSLVVTSDGGFALAGGSLLIKTDAYGVMEWNKTYEIPADILIVTADGGFALAGTTSSAVSESDFSLVKTDGLGHIEWNKTFGGTWYDTVHSLIETSDGGYALAGRTYDYGGSDVFDFLLVKTDAEGNIEWNQTYGTLDYVEECSALIETSDGGYAMAGRSQDFFSGLQPNDVWLVKTDLLGNIEWSRTYGGSHSDEAYSLIQMPDGGYAMAGSTISFGAGNYDFYLVKTDAYGNLEWNQTYGGAEFEAVHSLVETFDGGYAMAGRTRSFGSGGNDFYLVKTDSNGNMLWDRTYGGEQYDSANSLIVTSDGGFALAGGTSSFGSGDTDFWLIKTDEYGNIPEFPSWIIMPLFLISTLALLLAKRRSTFGGLKK